MLPFSSALSGHIRYLLQSLNESNSQDVFQEFCQYVGYGTEGSILILQTCLDHLNIHGKHLKNTQLEPIFGSIIKFMLDKPNFNTVLCESLISVEINEYFLENLANALHLSTPEKIGIGLALSDSENPDIRLCVRGDVIPCLPLTDITVSRILGTIVRTHAGLEDNQNAFSTFCYALGTDSSFDLPLMSSWNIDVLIDSIKQLAPETNWISVVENLDHEGFYFPNEAAFSFFMSVYKRACQDPFPLHAICGSVWKNTEGQLSFLKNAVAVPPEVFTFAHAGRQLAYVDAVHGLKFQPGHANHAWLCLDLLEVLCLLAERGHASAVQSMLKHPLEHCPEVLLLGMAHINTAYNFLQYEVSSIVFAKILKNSTGSGMVLHLWHVNPNLLVQSFLDAHNIDPDDISRVLDICQELKILLPVSDMVPSYFGIRLAAIASQKELLDLEKWLSYNLSTYRDIFFEECHKFLKEIQFCVYQDVSTDHLKQSGALWNLYLEASPTFLKLFDELEKLHVTFMHANSRMKNGGATDSSPSDGYADDTETEANSYFHQMFSGQYPERQLKIAAVLFGSLIKHQLVTHLTLGIALRGVLDALRKPADSKTFVFGTKALEQFLDRLVEWPQYCNHILQISHLRGSHSELVAFIERALARISSGHSESEEGLSAATDQQHVQAAATNMEMPGSSFLLIGSVGTQPGPQISSSIQLQQRHQIHLDDSQKVSVTSSNYVKPLTSTPGQPSAIPASDAASTQKSQSAASASTMLSSSTGFTRPPRAITSARFGSALNIETLVAAAERKETPLEAPASEIQDKISFIINNLSAANVEAKAKEFTEILKEQCYPWFAQYMVMKRASIEPNFHDLYLKFLDKINSKPLNKEIVQATYENCKVLLGSELIKSSSEERSLLKNLGSWLVKITIGINQVLRAREIDPKSLIVEAYEKGLMIAVIPFTSKILEPCQNSIAYQPPNPWTMGILGLLAEIYAMPNLKMNLKFDIEVLFKNLGVDLKDVTPTSLLKDRVRQVEGNPDFSNKDVGVFQPQIAGDVKSGAISTLHQIELSLEVASPSHPGGHSRILSQYAAPLHVSSGTLTDDEKLAALGLSDQLPSAQGLLQRQSPFSIPTSTSNIEQEVIVNPKLHTFGLYLHVQSVVPISMDRAIKEIVSGIVQRSVSIATQTTKELVLKDYAMELDETQICNAAHLMVVVWLGEPLRGSISSQLRNSLQGLNISSEVLEQAVQLVTNDNLDLGCALIEQAATEKAIQTIDGEIAQQLSLKRKHREDVGPLYFDSGAGVLPEALHPKPGRLSHSQQRVYEAFVRLPWQNQSNHSSNALSGGPSASSVNAGMSRVYSSASGQPSPGIYSSGVGNTGITAMAQPLDLFSEEMESSSAQLHSASSTHIGSADGGNPHEFENDAIVASFPSASASELPSVEASNIVKESGASSQTFPPTSATECLGSSSPEPLLTAGDALEKYQIISEKLETLVTNDANDADIQGIVGEVLAIILRCISRDEAALAVAKKVFKGLYENTSNSVHVDAHLAILAVIYSDEDRKFDKDITVGLICSELLKLAEYNVYMAKLLDGGRNKAATEFAISLIQTLLINDSKVISKLHNFVDALAKLAARPGSPESLQQLVARNPAANPATLFAIFVGEDNTRQATEQKAPGLCAASMEDYNIVESVKPDPAGFREQVSVLFAEWYRICELAGANDAACAHYVLQLQQSGLLKGDDLSDRFFRCLTELFVSHCLSSEVISSGPLQSPQQVQSLSFLAIDIYSKLVLSIIKVLAVTVRFIQKDAEERKASFNPRPYFRLFINWLMDLGSMEVFEGANFQVLTAFANAFHALQPLKIPGFSFAWLELVSHRSFMPKLLAGNAQKGWPYMQRLLVNLFQFLESFLRNAELAEPVHFLYKGTLRVLLVLLHDYPEFLCDYHFSLCNIDLLAEISQSPHILSEVDAPLKAKQIKGDVDEYLETRQQGSSFLTELKQKLLLPPNDAALAGTRYNVPSINSLVLYVGMQAIQQLQARTPHGQSMASSVPLAVFLVGAALDIFQTLIMDLGTEGRYLFLNAVANQLPYPNNHTHYFSFILLYLFAESNQEIIQEQITRVLLERLIVNRPHPWGLLITFIELIKNPRYNFWSRSFTRCAPEIEKLFESVSRSCGGLKPADESMVSGGISDNMH
ncbi:CCR4-NOT transcription complex subunit 1 [Camellia lanceoleosa]|uniref:CCR4-NOT transcription complex subunit 1 n=1 Tax=Camellia lanceoleosa TaxID=1840588 RepID=A0ACC0IFX9_9ERIC|nr:CCR4-NOT transcription complex subunit 1 [Camellia lanceoleosa]